MLLKGILNVLVARELETYQCMGLINFFSDEEIKALINQVCAGLICRWYKENPSYKKSLNAHAMSHGEYEKSGFEARLKMLQRTSQELCRIQQRTVERDLGADAEEWMAFVAQSKRKGIQFSVEDFDVVRDFTSERGISQLLKDIYARRILDIKKVSHRRFVEDFIMYEEWCSELCRDTGDVQFLHDSIRFFDLQKRTHIDLFYQIAVYMEEHGLTAFDGNRGRFWGILKTPGRWYMEPNQVLYYHRAIPAVFDDELFYVTDWKWSMLRELQAHLMNLEEVKVCVAYSMTEKLAMRFFAESYNVLEAHVPTDFGPVLAPNRERINLMRGIIKAMFCEKADAA